MTKIELLSGNDAVVKAAITAGCKFYGGYPITPSSEIAEGMAKELPQVNGKFIQMEDEIAGIGASIGASLTGAKAMTATSGPGFSLKQEHIGYAIMGEIPLVIVNVMRGGPSTGMPTYPAQSDVMQARWGTHGDHELIVLTPCSVQEIFKLTIEAFNLSEKYRVPVILLTDEIIAHMREKVEIEARSEYKIIDRAKPTVEPENYNPFDTKHGMVPPLAPYGEGYRFHITGLTHDHTGFPTSNPDLVEKLQERLRDKILDNKKYFNWYEERMVDDADIVVVAYGATARSAMRAIKDARLNNIKAGLYRPITMWPFGYENIKKIAKTAKMILVVEMNLGQVKGEVERAVAGTKCKVKFLGKANGELITPAEIGTKIMEVMNV
ncbi:TPA: 2-oxoacid:acceptor oxidoreductase subunit alpha [candidate division WOR-3 bacterium]|jgi:2-oxoglutarate ferredoxin oxidoreductase subunit alpha|uniref:2-oxoacid:acceptor oxidoreductase subunit alpha n=1 Tax=candidate division WOR-3 bacterium TaxID=2052148 RepID=A0A350H8G8_UNCW3|nr:2-oxoacid:acceptor oxidoreductase subunit alpha [candidate division WOR-3 bacterium]